MNEQPVILNSSVEEIIDCQDVNKFYAMGEENIHVLKDINFTLKKGECVAILGPSGSGKSTLMNILGCLDIPSSGNYFLSGKNVSQLDQKQLALIRNRQIGFIFQSFNLLPHATAVENVALPLVYRGTRQRERIALAQQLLADVGIADRARHFPNELSGGQRQRVAIARALITDPDIILADEPTGNLDSKTGKAIMDLLSELSQQGKTIIIVTHDTFVAKQCQRHITIRDGAICSD